MQYFVGIDIGTGSTKAIAYDSLGKVLAKAQLGYPTMHDQPGFSEQDPHTILLAVIHCLEELEQKVKAKPALISFSAAMHSLILVNQLGKPLTNSIIWSDNRAAQIAAQYRKDPKLIQWYKESGVPMHAMLPLCKIKWFREQQKQIFESAAKFIGIKEYVLFHLTGAWVVDPAVAAATGLLDIHTLDWRDASLKMAGIWRQQLPEIQAANYLLKPIAGNPFSLNQDTFIAVGSSDGAMANLGSGALDTNTLAITIGTSAAVRIIQDQMHLDEQMRSFSYPISKGQYLIGGASNNGAQLLEWMQTKLFQNQDPTKTFFEQADAITIGSDGLTILPYLSGERAPIWKEDAKAVFFGMGPQHGQAHLVRAAMEAVVFNLYAIAQSLPLQHQPKKIMASGGFIQNQVWLQMLADLFQLPVVINDDGDASARGALLLGLQSAFPQVKLPVLSNKVIEPNSVVAASYQKAFKRFEQMSNSIVPLM
jgi:gluconokinase